MNKEILINQAKELVRSGVVKGAFTQAAKNTLDNDDEFMSFIQSVADQANDELSRNSAVRLFGEKLVDIAITLFPEKRYATIPLPSLDEGKIKGGKADNLKPKDIADKFDLPVSKINRELQMGIKIEMEHTKSKKTAEDIAMDHLFEIPDYYTRLKKMEKLATTHWGKKEIKEALRKGLGVI